MNKKITFLAAAFSFAFFTLNAQDNDYLHCGSAEMNNARFAADPHLKAEYDQQEAALEQQDALDFQNNYHSAEHAMPPVYIVPIVFHILHQYGAENISDAQVLDEVNILNRDYRKLNADTSAIVNGFVASDVEIEFRLPTIDPSGNCTNGIEHIYSSLTNNADDGSKISDWPRNKYLNVWVVKTIGTAGVAGYSYFPSAVSGAPAIDGVLILSSYIGSIGTGNAATSRALTHEIGHYLNLQHTWGNTNNPGVACGNDGVTDTPVTKGYTSCQLTNNMICTANVHENVQNYMDYSYCSCMFTAGQRSRMRTAITSSTSSRNNLWTGTNLTNTGVNLTTVCRPIADFLPYSKVLVCAGGTVSFQDYSTNAHPTSWNWSFPGGTPATSTDSMPVIQYNTPGVYGVTETATNSAGSSSRTRTSLVYVSSTSAQYTNWQYTESFENLATFSSDWLVVNNDTNSTWGRTTSAWYTGAASCRIQNSVNMDGQIDELISPSIDFANITGGITFNFKVAFAQRTSTDADKLRVLVSTNCGQSWTQKYLKLGTNLSTVPAQTTSFIPTSMNQWRQESVTVTSNASNQNVRIKFEFTSHGGNNIYIDDINIQGSNGIDVPEAGIEHFDIVPNPANDNTNIMFGLNKAENTTVEIYDMTGRLVWSQAEGVLGEGDHNVPVNTGDLTKGIYFVRISTQEGKSATQKLIVN
jgi:PKD repeat protein